MSKDKKPYRVSISFPPEMADVIWAYAKEDDRTFTWEVVNMLKDLFDRRENDGIARPFPCNSDGYWDTRGRHQRIVKQLQNQKETQG